MSDTVRQRRSRTPISAISTDGKSESNVFLMPDLLPKTFKLDESCSLFSAVSRDETQSREVSTRDNDDDNDEDLCSMVEVKEHDLSLKMSIKKIDFDDTKVDTINVFETLQPLELEQAETVNIIDASSDTDTATSTPVTKRRSLKSVGSMDELKTELKRELETISSFDAEDEPVEEFSVKKQRISYEGKVKKEKDRDVLRDSEVAEEHAIKQLKLRPTLKELWMEERNSFYDLDDDHEEPLVFSDDEEIPRYSIEMDSDSDAVAAFSNKTFPIIFLFSLSLFF